ncbi:hypothetical protein BD779DRAFT_1482920 [Infundibulicybe gibba]|nr:hypothetical protein BD779DRAFT_1482920 [Infundibulicybe gibba]
MHGRPAAAIKLTKPIQMAPKEWPTDEQAAWLAEYLPEYRDIQSQSLGFSDFWAKIHENWFEDYPECKALFPGCIEAELSEEDTACLGKAVEVRRGMTITNMVSVAGQQQNQAIRWKKTTQETSTIHRIPEKARASESRIYLKNFYEEHIRDLEVAECEAQGITNKVLSVKPPFVIGQFFQDMARETGWSYTYYGWPAPWERWRRRCSKNALGNSFGLSYPDFDKDWTSPYMDFVKGIYPKSVCDARAMPTKIEDGGCLD